jgi:heme A synthase
MKRFSRFTWFVLGWNLLVILWGAFVRASGSGAGCGNHWPTCNGEIIPRPQQIETIIEFAHRLLSGGSLILILVMIIWGWRLTHKSDTLRKGLVASGIFIITEALLGAGLVLFGLVTSNQSVAHALAMALHLLNTFLLLASLTLTAYWASGGKPFSTQDKGYLPLFLGLGLLGVIFIGMSGAITALGDTLYPATSLAQGFAQDAGTNAHFLVRLRVWHPIIAVLVGVYTLCLITYLGRSNQDSTTRRLATVLGGLILVQWLAGLINLVLLAPIYMQILHLFIADCVWITYVLLSATVLKRNHLS